MKETDDDQFSVLMEMTGNLFKSFYAERKVWGYIVLSLGIDTTKYLFFQGLLKANLLREALSTKASEVHREVRVTFHPGENKDLDVLL